MSIRGWPTTMATPRSRPMPPWPRAKKPGPRSTRRRAAAASPPETGRDQRSLAVLAAVLPALRLLRALIARGLDINAAHAGMTPLLAATRDSWHGRPEAVMTLLANGADPRVRDRDGNTPL